MEQLAQAQPVRELSALITKNKGWIQFLGIMSIIGGVLTCLSIVGLLIGWLPIWLGIMLMKAASSAEAAQNTGSPQDLSLAIQQITKYFKVQAIMILAFIILYAVLIAAMIAMGGVATIMEAMDQGGVSAPATQ